MAIMSLRDYAKQRDLGVGYDAKTKNVSLGGQNYTPQQLSQMGGTLNNGSWQFGEEQLKQFGVQKPQTAISATPTVQAPQETGLVYEPGIGMVDRATSRVVTPDVKQAPQVDQMSTLLAQLKAAQQAQATEQYNRAFESARSGIQAQEQALFPKYQDIARQQQAQDTMARQAQLNQLQMGGLADSGARAQGDIAQNVITQGAMSNANLQQATERANLARMLQEAQSARDYGIASAGNEANLAQLQSQIGRAGQLEERGLADTRYNQEVAREDASIASKLAETNKAQAINLLPQYSKDYQARINQVTTDSDPTNDWEVPYLNILRGEKVQGIESGKAKVEQENYDRMIEERKLLSGQEKEIYDRAIQKYNAGIPVSQQEAQVLGVKVGAFKPKEVKASGDKGLSDAQQWTRIKDKLDMGIPLTPAEQAILGGTPSSTDKGIGISSFRTPFDRIIDDATSKNLVTGKKTVDYGTAKTKIASEIVKNLQSGTMKPEVAEALAVEYGIGEKELSQARARTQINPGNLSLNP